MTLAVEIPIPISMRRTTPTHMALGPGRRRGHIFLPRQLLVSDRSCLLDGCEQDGAQPLKGATRRPCIVRSNLPRVGVWYMHVMIETVLRNRPTANR